MDYRIICGECGYHGGDHDDDCPRRGVPRPPVVRVRRQPARAVTPADRAATAAEKSRLMEQLRAMGRCA